MLTSIQVDIKPLIANLRRTNINKFLCSNTYQHLLLENDFDTIWKDAILQTRFSIDAFSIVQNDSQNCLRALEFLLNSYYDRHNQSFSKLLMISLIGYFEWNNGKEDLSRLLTSINNIKLPNGDFGAIKLSFDINNSPNFSHDKTPLIDNMKEAPSSENKVFIVHGHDESAKLNTARFLEKLGLIPIILHEQASNSKTIIEKIEAYSNVGFAIILYTPCDIGGKTNDELKARARQNVVFEHGYFIGKIGRENVCALVKGDIETPNDISGVVYIPMDINEGWQKKVAIELRSSGYNVDMNKL